MPRAGERRLRVLLAKPGLDGHDRGVKVVARALREAGCEVIYLGLRSRPEAVAKAAVEEDVDVVGLSILSGSHLGLTAQILRSLKAASCDARVVVGGTIPRTDAEKLRAMGVAAVFPVSATLDDVLAGVRAAAGSEAVP